MARALRAALAAATLTFSGAASAQQVTDLPDAATQSVGIDVGLDSAVVTNVNYSHVLGPELQRHDVLGVARLSLPVATPDLGDYALEVGVRGTVLGQQKLRLQLQFGPLFRSSENSTFSARAIGAGLTILPGYQSPRWGLMAELGYEKILAVYLEPSARYREVAYGGAKEGWYGNTAGTLRFGLRGGVRLDAWELAASAGFMASEGFNPHLVPFYSLVGAAYAF